MMWRKVATASAALAFASGLFLTQNAVANPVQVLNLSDAVPGGTYQTATTQITGWTADANGTVLSSISDGSLTIAFSDAVKKGQVGATFGTWGSPPDTESPTPPILNTFSEPNVSTRTLNFTKDLSVFGVEVEGGDFSPAVFDMSFYEGATLIGTINRTIVGNSGARILGGFSTDAFNRVVITDTLASGDNSFAMAQFRYELAVPEPGSLAVFAFAALALLVGIRSTSRAQAR